MSKITTGYVNIAGSLHSIADDGIVAYTGDIYDPELKMTQREINSFDGGIHDDYGWQVVTLEKYNLMEHKEKVLYFIQDTEVQEESFSTISNNTIFMAATYSDYNININGSINDNNLILN